MTDYISMCDMYWMCIKEGKNVVKEGSTLFVKKKKKMTFPLCVEDSIQTYIL